MLFHFRETGSSHFGVIKTAQFFKPIQIIIKTAFLPIAAFSRKLVKQAVQCCLILQAGTVILWYTSSLTAVVAFQKFRRLLQCIFLPSTVTVILPVVTPYCCCNTDSSACKGILASWTIQYLFFTLQEVGKIFIRVQFFQQDGSPVFIECISIGLNMRLDLHHKEIKKLLPVLCFQYHIIRIWRQ